MKKALRGLISFGLPLLTFFLLSIEVKAQCPIVIDSIVAVDVTCSGAIDGSICVYVSGGFPNYTYQIFNGVVFESSGPQPTSSYCFTGLGSGTTNYQVIVVGEDGGGGSCTAVIGSATINVPPPFNITVTTVDESCPDSNDGEASAVVSGGVAPYTYEWPPFLTTNDTITGLDDGNYTVIVTDDNGCDQAEPFTINATPDWVDTLSGTDPTCFGGSDGSILSSGVTGGTPPYTFSWTGTAQTTENLTNLSAGSYTLTVTDATGCTRVFPTVTLNEPTPIIITESHVDVSCDGLTDGSINASVFGGTLPYTYSWSNGEATQDLTGIGSGTYLLTVLDANGCLGNISVTVLPGSALSISAFSVNAECNEANGSIDISVSGGSGNYSYDWQPGSITTEDLSGLDAGTYEVTVTDNTFGCLDSLTVNISNFPGHEITGIIADGSNCVSNDGEIDITVTGGSGDFGYSWSHGPSVDDVTGLSAGTYTVTVTDNVLGCISIATFNVQGENQIIVTANVVEPSCSVINGSIDLNVSGGSGPYVYSWSNGDVTEDISNLGPGTYAVTIIDINGCPLDTSFSISNAGGPTVSAVLGNPNCPGGSDGSIDLIISGGVGPFVVNWSNGGSTTSISSLPGGTYVVTVTDQGSSCLVTESYTLITPPPFYGDVDIQNLTCGGADDGSIDLTLTGGTPPYTFLWNPGGFTTEDISGLSAGNYLGVATDANGCTASGNIPITSAPELVISETHEDITCNGDNDGSIDISVSGGTGPFDYLWQPNGEITEDLSGLGSDTYEVFVIDAAGCSDSLEIEILEPAVLTNTNSFSDASCFGQCDGDATVIPVGGTGPFTYTWTPNVSTGPTANALCAGTYDVLITDANGCQDSASFTITDNQLQVVVNTSDAICNSICDGEATAVVTGTNPPYTYDWQPSGGTGPTEIGLCAGNYTLTVEDAAGCSLTQNFTIVEPDPIVISMAVTDVSCEGGSDGAIDLTVLGGTPGYTYQWFPLGQTTEDIENLPAGDYSILVTDTNGCRSSTVVLGGSFDGGTLALPDGTGAVYNTDISITGFPSGSTLSNISDFGGVCIEMEHSWLSDLDIELSCPNGQTVLLEGFFPTGQTGASVFLGDANDNDNVTPVPGVGFEYCWDNNPTYGTMEAEAGAGNTVLVSQGDALPPGSYTSVDPLSGLVGCPLNGDWTITITDNFALDNGFIFDWNIALSGGGVSDSLATVNEPGPITLTPTVTDANCGSCDGAITVVPAGGVAPYTFLWNTGATTATITNLCAGVYNAEITDANGCSQNFFIPVDNLDGPTGANTIIVDASCFGVCDGEATVTGIGGAPPYTYQWVPGGFSTSNVTGLCQGTYNVQIQDSLNCIYTETIVIGSPDEIVIGQTIVNSLCGQCTGEIDLTPISGTPPYSYTWTQPGLSGTNPTGLCAGVYNVTVTDVTGCSEVVTSLINDIPPASITMTGIDPLCNDSCNGEAIATPTGGTAPFTYLWDDPNAQTDSIASGLCEGLYTITLTDANGCIAVNQVNLTQPDPIGLSLLIIDNGTCGGNCDGAITVIPSGGSIPFTYLWDDPLNQTTATAIDLCAGTYSVEVTDANGCIDITTGVVNNPVDLTATATATDGSCNGLCDGSAFITPVGGTPPFTYLWDDPSGTVTDTAVGLCAGSYTVTVTDINGCDFLVPVTIAEPDPIVITFSNIVNLQCDGICVGEVTADVIGGTGPYTYQWDDALLQNTQAADSLCASSYTVTVTDANGCVASETVTITGPNGLSASIISQTNVSCNATCDGTAVVEATGGTAPYSYEWNDVNNTANDTITGLCEGTYGVTVTDDNGCISVSTVVITEPNPLSATTTADDVSCFGECDGEATAFTVGGTFPYTYQWNDLNNQTTLTAVGLCTGSYGVEITDVNGCIATALVDIFEPTEITIDTTIVDATCGQCNGEITITPDGGVPSYTYLWGNGETTASISGLCPGVYTVDVTDVIGCTVNFDIAVSNIGGPTSATVVTTDASCFGVCDGEASVTPVGGIPPYTYLWVPGGQTDSTITGLCAGTYNVQITDSAGCIYTQLVTIDEPSEIEGNGSVTQATCGQCNGEIVLTPSGGDGGPYTYSWSPNVSVNDTASNLCAGIYAVTITDNAGCESVETIPVNNIDGPSATGFVTDATCDGFCDGTAWVSIFGGAAPYTVVWDDPSAQTDTIATGLCAGLYNATITDSNGCEFTAQVQIEDPDLISLSQIISTDATCAGVCDGTATVIPSGGTLPYTYSWPSGGTSATETGLCAGTYTVTVTDANGCEAQQSVTIEEPPVIVINTNTLNASCFGLCDGEAYAEATGGSGGFTYQWNDLNSTANDTATGLCAGTYTIVVTDANSCTDSTDVTINEPDSIAITITPTSVTCNGDCDGSAIAVATGGNAPYTYQWNDPNSTANDTVVDLCAGIYGLVVTDSLGCTATSSTVISEPLVLTLLDSAVNITCGGTCDGIAGVLPLGGTAPYGYSWDDTNNSTNPFILNLCAGTYQVIVTDANGCSDSTTVTITEPPVLDSDVEITNPTCGGVCDGEITLSPVGGTPGYTVLWLPNLETDTAITALCAGQYIGILVDAAGCTDTTIVNLTEPPILTADITSVTQVLCAASCSAEATVTPSGGTPPFTYDWTTSPAQTDSTATGLCVGIWSVTVTDDIGCTANASVAITDSAALTATVPISTSVTCNGEDDGTATAFANGGVAPYTYAWDDANFQNTQTATGLAPGTYTVTVTDSQSPACVVQASVTIIEPIELTLITTVTDVTCGTDCDGIGAAAPLGGTPPYVITWDDPTGLGVDLCVGTWNATVTDANGCSTSDAATVGGPTAIVSNATSVASTCSNLPDGSIDLTVVGGDPGYTFDWTPGGSSDEDLTNVEFGVYTVFITDATGCSMTSTYSIGTLVQIDADAGVGDTVCSAEPILLDGTGGGDYLWSPSATLSDSAVADPIANPIDTTTYTLTVTISNCVDVDSVTIYTYETPPVDAGDSLQIPTGTSIGLNSSGVQTGWQYSWEPAEFLDNSGITNPLASPDESTTFYVTVVDDNGCTNFDSVYVEVLPGIDFPDGISPNGDGINDTWIIDNIDLFDDATVEVYNRWGQILFQSAPGYPVPWDGRFKGKDLPVGTYYYVIYSDNFEDPFTGPITIIR
jgi:gliding motility-associated-like protein